MESKEFYEGEDCYLNGGSDADCPYPVGSDEALDWNDGWAEAEQQESDE